MALAKSKRRTVSAVRDFPPGCGIRIVNGSQNSNPVLNSLTSFESSVGPDQGSQSCDGGFFVRNLETVRDRRDVETVLVDQENGGEVDKVECLNSSENSKVKVNGLMQGVLDVKRDVEVVLTDQENGEELNKVECLKNPENAEVKLNDLVNGVIDIKKDVGVVLMDRENEEEMECPNNLENLEVKVNDLVENVINVGGLKDLSNVGVIDDGTKGMTKRTYPPRRIVSAVRDFPPLCGSNVPLLGTKQNVMVVVSKDENGSFVDGKEGKERMEIEAKQRENFVQDSCVHESTFARNDLQMVVYEEKAGLEEPKPANCVKGFIQDNVPEKCVNSFKGSTRDQDDVKTNAYLISGKNIGSSKETTDKKPPYKVAKTLERCSDLSIDKDDNDCTELWLESYCGAGESKGKEKLISVSGAKRKELEISEQQHKKKKSSTMRRADQFRNLMVVEDQKDAPEQSEKLANPTLPMKAHNLGVSLPPSRPNMTGTSNQNDMIVTRSKVRETLRLFQAICRKIMQEDEAKSKGKGSGSRRIDCLAARMLKENGKYVNTGKQIIGPVPGVEVGDEFTYRIELNIVGLHRQTQGGIDYVKQGKTLLATSVVASGGYDDHADNSDILIYTGSGGNMTGGDKEPEDQKLERGNLALKNSIDVKNPVRVIKGETKTDSSDARGGRIYVYDGLYLVEKCWQEMGPHGKLVFKFRLARIPGQPELAWKVVKKSKKFKVREGVCFDDISRGKEVIPICAVNTIDGDKPPAFEYVTHLIYPDWYKLDPPQGCGCINDCSESENCSCAVKNGEIPYNHNGAIVEAKPIVYECGPLCKCTRSCHNRVTQLGIKFQLEIFKTERRGWGVRSLNSIPSGSFICEYAGEVLEEKEAEQKIGNDDYLFDIGNNFKENSVLDGLSTVLPNSVEEVIESSFTIDAASCGNVGRFINHSCSPNLYAQNVLYDHNDKRIPHIMFFAVENIPPLQELTYDYNYLIDHVHDSAGNIKKKDCYCGSSECRGRLY